MEVGRKVGKLEEFKEDCSDETTEATLAGSTAWEGLETGGDVGGGAALFIPLFSNC